MSDISVIVPIYQASKYLKKCIDSILIQTYKEFELILIDDGSTDGCYEICEEYKKLDNRVKVYHKKNEGLVRARKDGIRIATGKYISYVDADDWIEPNMLEVLYEKIKTYNCDIVICGRFEDTGELCISKKTNFKEGFYNKQDMIHDIYPKLISDEGFFEWGLFPAAWDKIYRKELLEKHQMEVDDVIMMGEDAACTYPCVLNAESIYILNECFYHYRQTNTSMVKSYTDTVEERKRFNVLYNSANDILKKYRNIYNVSEQWKKYILFLMIPRAGVLYNDIEKLDYLFPYPKVKVGSKIIIYGMGTYGHLLFRFIEDVGLFSVVAVADRNYIELRKSGMNVIAPEDMEKYEFDFIVIANSFANTRQKIYKELVLRFSEDKICMMDEELIMSDETMIHFGLK